MKAIGNRAGTAWITRGLKPRPEPGLPQPTIGHLRALVGRMADLQAERNRVELVLAAVGGRALAAEKDFDDPVAFALWGVHGLLCDALGIDRSVNEEEGR